MSSESFLLEMNNIFKSFPGVRALENVSFHLRRGEVFALVGENGAGKSTLIKAISGAVIPDEGEIWLEGERICFNSPMEARAAAGDAGYAGGFVEHYLLPVLYPQGLTRSDQLQLAMVLVAVNVVIYAFVVRSVRRGR